MSLDIEPEYAMFARDGMGAPCWFYPDNLDEARHFWREHGARPHYPFKGTADGFVFPWTEKEVKGL